MSPDAMGKGRGVQRAAKRLQDLAIAGILLFLGT
jgi:hypothetical protein